MFYYANFKDINMQSFRVEINTAEDGLTEHELTLSGTPVIIKQEGSELFAPIKGTTCTINIESDGGLFDLYTTDPQGVKVVVSDLANGKVVFRGYATPMQYEQDWTSIDTLSLECVDCVSSLKEMPYRPVSGEKQYQSVRSIIENCFINAFPEDEDSIFRWFRYYWPQYNFMAANTYNFSNTRDMIDNISLNEANFFDDDDEQTPWSYWQVLEEICKYFCVSLVCYQGAYWFVDYLYSASSTPGTAMFWMYDLDNNYYSASLSKSMTFSIGEYTGGTSELSTDDTYNIIAVNTNRYDIDEIVNDPLDEDYHISITKEQNFGGQEQIWTHTVESGWWLWANTQVTARYYMYKNYCRLNASKCNWRHTWWSPRSMVEYGNYYSTAMNGYSQFINLPENKYINTIGATILHYATFEDSWKKPSKLDWNNVIMFQCMTDTVKPESTGTMGVLHMSDICPDRNAYEVPVLTYTQDYEMNFSPKQGNSWIVINCALWYQQNMTIDDKTILPINFKTLKETMCPVEDITDWDPYKAMTHAGNNTNVTFWRNLNHNNFGEGWKLLQVKLQIGDKYWDGSGWTTTPSTFYISFIAELDADEYTYNNNTETTWDAFAMLKWMNIVSNTDYQAKIGAEGYCIPIQPSDAVCGVLKLTLYTPRQVPAGLWTTGNYAQWYNGQPPYTPAGLTPPKDCPTSWYQYSPVVFMKDFQVDYVYTDESEWWLNREVETDDIKYCNDTKDRYKYTKENTLKINSWQDQRPISKSFPIVRFDNNNTEVCEFLDTTVDASNYSRTAKQEEQIVDRQLRHYAEPRKKYTCHRRYLYAPYSRIQLSDASDLEGVFVVGSQEYDVRNRNNTVELIEFGDAQIYQQS